MEIYLVGGAVRDSLLGLPVRERDWVVVGSSPAAMLALGYRQVGKDFPVFLHPQTGEEYALARTERKTARGYTGFTVHAGPDVTLEEDLLRRDLTINALAQDKNGLVIDPFGGREDLERRSLRHVSDAFVEDPVRILRAARFAARFAPQGFTIAAQTNALMSEMVANGEVDALVSERVWQETAKAMVSAKPSVYFEALRACGALARVFSEIDALYGVIQPPKWHPEIDTGVHTMMVVDQAAKLSPSLAVRFAALTHDLGKALTPADMLPSHRGHEQRSVALIETLCQRLRVPNECRDLARIVAAEHGHIHRVFELKPATLLKVLERMDAIRRPQRFEEALLACEADSRGRLGLEDEPYPQADYLRAARACVAAIEPRALDFTGLTGEQIGAAITAARLAALKEFVTEQRAGQTKSG